MKSGFTKDILKCAKISLFIAVGIFLIFGLIYFTFYNNGTTSLSFFLKDSLYYIGCFGFLISIGFFMQKNATRPLKYQDQWNKMFSKLNLGFSIMFISFFICLYGMAIQLIVELKLL